MALPADFDIEDWARRNNAPLAKVVDGKIISVHEQFTNWHLCISPDPWGYEDDY